MGTGLLKLSLPDEEVLMKFRESVLGIETEV
jgi:hypothetical protein